MWQQQRCLVPRALPRGGNRKLEEGRKVDGLQSPIQPEEGLLLCIQNHNGQGREQGQRKAVPAHRRQGVLRARADVSGCGWQDLLRSLEHRQERDGEEVATGLRPGH